MLKISSSFYSIFLIFMIFWKFEIVNSTAQFLNSVRTDSTEFRWILTKSIDFVNPGCSWAWARTESGRLPMAQFGFVVHRCLFLRSGGQKNRFFLLFWFSHFSAKINGPTMERFIEAEKNQSVWRSFCVSTQKCGWKAKPNAPYISQVPNVNWIWDFFFQNSREKLFLARKR
jgi:hypothetical protein